MFLGGREREKIFVSVLPFERQLMIFCRFGGCNLDGDEKRVLATWALTIKKCWNQDRFSKQRLDKQTLTFRAHNLMKKGYL